MAVNLTAPRPQDLYPVKGVTLGVAEAGIRKAGRKDLMVMQLAKGSSVGAVFTQNRFCAAPVQVSKLHLAQGNIRALVVNTGNANAGTGESGLQHTQDCCVALAAQLGIAPQQVLPFSTGVIMEPLPIDKLIAGLPAAVANAGENHWANAAQAIMTTDTLPKAFSERVQVGEQVITVTGISKGAGMIRPNMATMLGFMATDACIAPALMQGLAHELAEQSFNRITIDGDTSTNDSFVVVATHQAGNTPLENWDSPLGAAVKAALYTVSRLLAQAIVRDGEGATKFMTISITGGRDTAECRLAAYAIAHSPLVKTAFFASDPNLGRILAAVGYAGIADLDQSLISLCLDDVLVVQKGGRNPAYQEEQGQRIMKQTEITVRVDLGRGTAQDSVWTCDLSYEYVKINADYRS